jgi:YebC/PmpR family DNA-binding regulatory protein
MSGHSKWSQIKRQKGVSDAAKSRVFSKFAREISLESKKSAGNISSPSLAAVIARAKAANMPKENIERAVTKGTSKDSGDLEAVTYEFYGPGGVAIIATAVTDSKNRTTQEIKSLLAKNDYELGVPGSSTWAFAKQPDGRFKANEPLMEVAGADETNLSTILTILDEQDDVQEIFTNARDYESTGD